MNQLEIVRDGRQIRVMLGEKLAASDTPALQPALKQAIGSGAREIIFDFARTTALDSTGIGLLIATNNSLVPLSGSVRLANVPTPIMKLLRSMRLGERLQATAAAPEVPHG